MGFDFYAEFAFQSRADVDQLTWGSDRYEEISDVFSRALPLSTVFSLPAGAKFPNDKGEPDKVDPKEYARTGERNFPSGLKSLVYSSKYFDQAIECSLSQMAILGLTRRPDLDVLPPGSWLLEFPLTLARPFISRDDIPLYIIDNPLRKDKVFAVPFVSAAAWKGNLRWAIMKVELEPKMSDPGAFAESRFRHFLLFGTEKGLEEKPESWIEYLDKLCRPGVQAYQNLIRGHFNREDVSSLHVQGMLYFYPTFWNKMDMEVINPHNRRTGAGTLPIHFETVPAGARGTFRLLYLPLHWLTLDNKKQIRHSLQDLGSIVRGLEALMLTYGFSAKKSSGFGIAKGYWNSSESYLKISGFEDKPAQFGSFTELSNLVSQMQKEAEQ